MNDDRLSPREHTDMRDLVLAGAQRIRPAGAHRAAFTAGAVALVLVVGVTVGALSAAGLFGSAPDVAPMVSPSATATPTPTPTPTRTPTATPTTAAPAPEVRTAPTLPFAGDCRNVLTDDEASSAASTPMALSDYRWRTGAEDVLGGIDCIWLSTQSYGASTVNVFAYPESVVPAAVRNADPDGCVATPGSGTICTLSTVVGGTWLQIRNVRPEGADPAAQSQAAFDDILSRFARYPAPAGAPRTSEWWTPVGCVAVADGLDPIALGFERVDVIGDSDDWTDQTHPAVIPWLAGADHRCELNFSAGSGDSATYASTTIDIIPGGAVAFDTALAADGAQPMAVADASAAVLVPDNDRFDGGSPRLLVSDGVNVLSLSVNQDIAGDVDRALALAAQILASLHP